MKHPANTLLALATGTALLLSPSAHADYFDTNYSPGGGASVPWAPFSSYNLGGNQQTDKFYDLTFHTHGALTGPNFTNANGSTLSSATSITTGSYIRWGMYGFDNFPPNELLGPIQSGSVTKEMVAAANIVPKALDAARSYSVSTDTPIANLQTLVVQLRVMSIFPESIDYTPFEMGQVLSPVVLNVNGGELYLNWDARSLDYINVDSFSSAYTQEVWSFQWDLSGITDPIDSFSVSFDLFPYGTLSGVEMIQSDHFESLTVVPEPSTYALAAVGMVLAFYGRRRLANRALA